MCVSASSHENTKMLHIIPSVKMICNKCLNQLKVPEGVLRLYDLPVCADFGLLVDFLNNRIAARVIGWFYSAVTGIFS